MDFTHEGLIRIEDKPGEGEVLGLAIGLGQAFVETIEARGHSLQDLDLGNLPVATFLGQPSTEGIKEVMNKFKDASIDASARVLTPEETIALCLGLGTIDILSDAGSDFKAWLSKEGGHNARRILLDRSLGKIAHRYNVNVDRALEAERIKDPVEQ